MQNRHIRQLAIKLRRSYRNNRSWRLTSKECKVFTEDCRVNPGLAKRIARDGYQPSDDVIDRLTRHGAIEMVKHNRPVKLFDMPTSTLRYKLEHREEMPPLDVKKMRELMREFRDAGLFKRARVAR